MWSDLEPLKVFLSLRGSGQSLYVGAAPDGWVVSSEVYGLVQAAKARARGYRTTANLATVIYLIAGKLDFRVTHCR